MDLQKDSLEDSEDLLQISTQKQANALIPLPYASISLSLSSLISSNLSLTKTPAPRSSSSICFSSSPPPPSSNLTVKTSLSYPFHSSFQNPTRKNTSSLNSSSNSTTVFAPLRQNPRNFDPSPNGFYGRRTTIVWFRNDLRVHDNEALSSADNESLSVLPVYVFDPQDYGKSSSGFDKTGPYRATFLLQAVADLRDSLKKRGSDLVVRIGRPDSVIANLAKKVGADGVFAHREVSSEEVKAEEKVEASLADEGIEMKWFWGSTLFHLEDLPFKLGDMPANYGGFREKVKGLKVRNAVEISDKLKGIPAACGEEIESGRIPTLADLGLTPVAAPQHGKPAANASLVGGETEALKRLEKFASDCRANLCKETSKDNIYGANFSCKISPWLATGCLSPRYMFNELKKNALSTVNAALKNDGASSDDGSSWLMFELLWRDFFRFITKKYSSSGKTPSSAPVTACTGSFA